MVESLGLFIGPERVERTNVKRFGFAASFELKENFNLFFEEVTFLIGERRFVLAERFERLVVILFLDQVINELFDDLKRAGIGSDQSLEKIRPLIFLEPMQVRHFDQFAQYRRAFVPRSGDEYPLPRSGLIGEPGAAMVETGELFERRQAVFLKLDVTQRPSPSLLDITQLFVKLGQLQLDFGILWIE